MGVVASAGEAPFLHIVHHVDFALGVPCLRRDVDAVYGDDLFLVPPAGVAMLMLSLTA
jgi:hypothetical protein